MRRLTGVDLGRGAMTTADLESEPLVDVSDLDEQDADQPDGPVRDRRREAEG